MILNKGFTYIITTMLLIILISGVVIVSNYNSNKNKTNPVATLAKNYENEFLNILETGSTVENINLLNYRLRNLLTATTMMRKSAILLLQKTAL